LAAAIIQKVGKAIVLALPLGNANHAYDPAIAICLGAISNKANEQSRRLDMSAGNLAAWNIDASDFPSNGTAAEKARFAVAYAILAPSSHNTQPWRFVVIDDELLVCADRSRSLAVIDPFDREMIISCGAALFNLRVVFSHFAVPVEVTTFPQSNDPDVLARILFPRSGSIIPDLGQLFNAMKLRVTNRYSFAEEAPPNDLLERVRLAAAAEGVDISIARSQRDRERVAALVAEADRRQFSDPHFRRELASWIHPSRSSDGMPAYSQGVNPLLNAATPMVAMAIRTFDVGHGVAATHEALTRGSPLLVVLSTAVDNNESWLATGQGLERLLLVAAASGFSASYLNQPIEVPELRRRLADDLGAARYPQLVLRIGRGPAVPHSPRRSLTDVLA
jgi:nitroreductase